MDFSPQQDAALKAVAKWLKSGRPQLFRLFGYAGTGKTTLARYFAEHVDGQVQFAAFTGKAAQVLRSKGAVNARTIHSLIYKVDVDDRTGDANFILNEESALSDAALLIVDSSWVIEIGRFSQARIRPASALLRSKLSRLPSFLTTMYGISSIRSATGWTPP